MHMSSSLRRRLGFLLRVIRLRAELDQRELAERLGVSQPTISRWERDGTISQYPMTRQWIKRVRGDGPINIVD